MRYFSFYRETLTTALTLAAVGVQPHLLTTQEREVTV
jgi:hypothetical protein